MKAEILKILKKEKDYVSGQELCESLGVSRTAVWKAIRQLEEQTYGEKAVEAHVLRRIFTTIRILNGDTDELTTTLVVAYHQDGIQAAIPNVPSAPSESVQIISNNMYAAEV